MSVNNCQVDCLGVHVISLFCISSLYVFDLAYFCQKEYQYILCVYSACPFGCEHNVMIVHLDINFCKDNNYYT